MDWRRSCARSVMQIERPSEGQYKMPVVWYFAPAGAKTYYGINAFSGGIWDHDKVALPPELGEQPPYSSPWYNGKNAWGYLGQRVQGTPDQFGNGLTAAEVAAPPPNVLPCLLGPDQTFGGVILGGIVATQGVGPPPGSGGVLLGGKAPASSPVAGPARGGVLLGGVVQSQSPFGGPGTGGVLLGAKVGSLSPVIGPSSGGVLLGGVVQSQSPNGGPGAGGVLLGGVVQSQASAPDVSGGGILLGGVVTDLPSPSIPITGGVVLGGVVSSQGGTAIPTAGGVLLGGVVGTQEGWAIPTVGGVLLGGVVAAQSASTGDVSGGVLLGGVVAGQTSSPSVSGGVLLGGIVSTSGPAVVGGTDGGVLLGGVVASEGGNSAGVPTACCPGHPTPLRVYAHFLLSGNPANNVTIPIDYDAGLALWHDDGSYHFGICTADVNLVCASDGMGGFDWRFQGNEFGSGWDLPPIGPPDCTTFSVSFDLTTWAALLETLGCYAPGEAPQLLTIDRNP